MLLSSITKIKKSIIFSLKTYPICISISLFLCILFIHFLSLASASNKFGERGVYRHGFKEVVHAIPVKKVMLSGKMIRIKAGYLHGVTKGSTYIAYNKENIANTDVAKFVITKVRVFSSDGEVQCGSFNEDDLVTEETHAYPYKPIKIFCEASFPKDEIVIKEIAEEINKIPGLEIIDIQNKSDITIFIVRPKITNSKPEYESASHTLPLSFEHENPEVWIFPSTKKTAHEYLRVSMENTPEGIQSVLGNLQKILHIREVKYIASSQHKTKPIDFQTIIMRSEDSCDAVPGCVILPNGNFFKKIGIYSTSSMEGKNLDFGQMITFLITNNSTNTYYCYLVNISPNGKIETIFPDITYDNNVSMVKAGETLDISTEAGVLLNCIGEETIKLFATKEPFNISLLEQPAYESKDISNHLDLHETIHTTGSDVIPEEIANHFECDDWEIEQYSFCVK